MYTYILCPPRVNHVYVFVEVVEYNSLKVFLKRVRSILLSYPLDGPQNFVRKIRTHEVFVFLQEQPWYRNHPLTWQTFAHHLAGCEQKSIREPVSKRKWC
jgi:hypothetical protein